MDSTQMSTSVRLWCHDWKAGCLDRQRTEVSSLQQAIRNLKNRRSNPVAGPSKLQIYDGQKQLWYCSLTQKTSGHVALRCHGWEFTPVGGAWPGLSESWMEMKVSLDSQWRLPQGPWLQCHRHQHRWVALQIQVGDQDHRMNQGWAVLLGSWWLQGLALRQGSGWGWSRIEVEVASHSHGTASSVGRFCPGPWEMRPSVEIMVPQGRSPPKRKCQPLTGPDDSRCPRAGPIFSPKFNLRKMTIWYMEINHL